MKQYTSRYHASQFSRVRLRWFSLRTLVVQNNMLIELFRELAKGAPFNPYNPYDDEDVDDADDDQIDEVDCANSVQRKKLLAAVLKLGFAVLIIAISIIASPGAFEELVLKETPKGGGGETDEDYLDVLSDLVDWGILSDVTKQHTALRSFGSIFTVKKAGGKRRLIFDGRPLNKWCHRPFPVNLPGIAEILVKARRCKVIVSGDLRHWFHQIGLFPNTRKYFGVRCGKSYFMSNTLPMGFCFSPHIAQATSWTLIFHKEDGAAVLFDSSCLASDRLPRYVNVLQGGKVVGFVCITYDNFGVFLDVDDPVLTKAVVDRLKGNATHFGIVWKELSVHTCNKVEHVIKKDDSATDPQKTGKKLRTESTSVKEPENVNAIFLGVEIDISNGSEIRWRHAPKRDAKMKGLARIPGSFREAAEIVGHVIWDSLISLRRLADVQDIISILKDMSKHITKKSDWNIRFDDIPGPSLVTTAWLAEVNSWRNDSSSNPWRCNKEALEPQSMVLLCSDAADSLMGGVQLGVETPVILDKWFKAADPSTHIFIKEVLAAIFTIKWAAKNNAERPLHIKIAIDSISARRAIEKAYSSNYQVCALLSRFWKWIDEELIILECLDIDTKLNLADCLTRDASKKTKSRKDPDHPEHPLGQFCDARIGASWRILHGQQPGRCGVPKEGPWLDPRDFYVPEDSQLKDSDEEWLENLACVS